MKELTIEVTTENLEAAREFIDTELQAADCPAKTRAQITLAFEEIFVNIAHYAYQPRSGDVVIRVAVGDEVVLEFEDGGKPYNPLKKNNPDISAGAEERPVGGLGIFMAKNVMDDMEYRHENNKNILVVRKALRKKLPKQEIQSWT